MEKKEKVSTFANTIVIVVLMLVIAAMIIAFVSQYVKYSSEYVEKGSISKFYIKKDVLSFSDLPQHTRALYISKTEATKIEQRLQDNIKMIEKSTITDRYLGNITFVDQIECANFKPTSHVAPSSCKKKLARALLEMNNNMIYEIIPIVNSKDFDFIERMVDEGADEENKIEYKERMQDFMEYANRGLSHYRANEAIWILKQSMGKEVKIRNSSFHMFTKDKAGFVIKVFNYIE